MDIETGKVSDAVMITKGVRPLKFTEVKGIKSFVDGVYFGGYLSNPNKIVLVFIEEKRPLNGKLFIPLLKVQLIIFMLWYLIKRMIAYGY